MELNEAIETLENAGYLVEDGQQMTRPNLRKWLTNRFGIEFDKTGLGKLHGLIVIEVPDDSKLPINALDVEFENSPFYVDTASLFLDESDTLELMNFKITTSLKDITNLSKPELSSFMYKLDKKTLFVYRMKKIVHDELNVLK